MYGIYAFIAVRGRATEAVCGTADLAIISDLS